MILRDNFRDFKICLIINLLHNIGIYHTSLWRRYCILQTGKIWTFLSADFTDLILCYPQKEKSVSKPRKVYNILFIVFLGFVKRLMLTYLCLMSYALPLVVTA